MKPRLVVLGTGFGALSLLKDLSPSRYATTVISPRNHFLFTPLLPSTTVGTIEFLSIAEPIRLAAKGATFMQASAFALDPLRKAICCKDLFSGKEFDIYYDVLVIAVGAASNTFGIEGVMQHALFLKELSDARLIRQKVIDNLEQASLPTVSEAERKRLLHFVVVGGGPTGVEYAAELADFFDDEVKMYFPNLVQDARITLVEAGKQILSSFDESLASYTLKVFQRRRIKSILNTPVKKVEAGRVHLATGEVLETGLIVWSTGNGPTPFVKALPFQKDRAGRILTDRYLRVLGQTNIFALGDCATIEGYSQPATAQVAMQAGKYLAKLLNRAPSPSEAEKSIAPFERQDFGMLAYIGDDKALADLPNVKWKGFLTWLFWRAAYLTKLVSIKNKMQVLFDWIKSRLFGRDLSRF
ncbi:MAG: FAD-dependent oxidoreductase [Candidatus Thermochlorobacter sp.]